MSLPLGRVSLGAQVATFLSPEGLKIRTPTHIFTSANTGFPWQFLFETCYHGVAIEALLECLRERGVQGRDALDVLAELIQQRILLPETDCPAATQYHHLSSFGHFRELQRVEETDYCDVERALTPCADQPISLPDSLAAVLTYRRSCRDFGGQALDSRVIETILWAAYGNVVDSEGYRRTVPSAGAEYPLILRVFVQNVKNTSAGVYNYLGGKLDQRSNGLPNLSQLFLTRHISYTKAAAVVLIVATPTRMYRRYGERGYRYLLLEAGHVAQNLCLAATSLRVPHVPIGAFDDDAINGVVCGSNEFVVYSVALGGL